MNNVELANHPYPESETLTEKRVPFAFDLEIEYQHIREYGEGYRPFFLEQAHYFAKESYGKVPLVEYEHRVKDGVLVYEVSGKKIKARDSYRRQSVDTSLPDWYRARAFGDLRWVDNLERHLSQAGDGDLFFDLSPTSFQISLEERQRWGFGTHSFVRLHQVVGEGRLKKLVSRAPRNYLDLPEQARLFEAISGRHIEGQYLLGEVAKIDRGTEIGHVQKLVDDLYRQTPAERKIIPPQNDQIIADSQEMDAHLVRLDWWLNNIFDLMAGEASKNVIEKQFHGWENAVKDLVRRGTKSKQLGQTQQYYPDEDWFLQAQIVDYYTQQPYFLESNSCGRGSGFSRSEISRTEAGPMDYLGLTNKKDEWKKGDCRRCEKKETMVGPCSICKDCEKKFDLEAINN